MSEPLPHVQPGNVIRTETPHELLCRASGITPAQLNEQQRRIGRFLWHLVGIVAGIGLGCWMCGHLVAAAAFLLITVATMVFLVVVPGEFDPVTGQRVHKAIRQETR